MISGLPSGTNYLMVMGAAERLSQASGGKKRAERAFQKKMTAMQDVAQKRAKAEEARNNGKAVAATGQTIGAGFGVAAGVAGIVAAVAVCCGGWPVAAVAGAIAVVLGAVGALIAAGASLYGVFKESEANALDAEASKDQLEADHAGQKIDDQRSEAREKRQMIIQNLQWALQADSKGKDQNRRSLGDL